MALLELKSVHLSLGGPPVLDGVDLRVERGERICLLGRNGAGKTTLLRLLDGAVEPDAGEVLRPRRLQVGYLPQEVPGDLTGTVRAIVTGHLESLPTAADDTWRADHVADRVLTRSGLDGDAVFADLSAGNKRRVLLARALAGDPDVLLLDEPTNHLDIDAITWLESELQRFDGTLFFVTHDRAFLRGLARRIVELDRGRVRDWTCDYDTFLRRRDEYLRDEQARWAEFDRKLAEEEAWIRQGVRERRTRNEGRVRELKRMRAERAARRTVTGAAALQLQDAERSGRLVIRADDLCFDWDGLPMVKDLDTMIMRGDRVGILGPNGAGKTTLLRLLLGELSPTRGSVRLGTKLQVAYFDQQRQQLDETKTVAENLGAEGDTVPFEGRRLHVVTYLQRFLFAPDRARSPITHLSGGERNRLLLARLFTQPANLLVLDEPTNDLDLETLELLEEMLQEADVTLLLVSHDREFLDNVTTSTLALTGGGQVVETVGGYADWERVSRTAKASVPDKPRAAKQRTRPATDRPRRLTYREQKELEELPGHIEQQEAEQAGIHTRLGDPALYRESGDEVAELRRRLVELETGLPVLYARWEELEGLSRR